MKIKISNNRLEFFFFISKIVRAIFELLICVFFCLFLHLLWNALLQLHTIAINKIHVKNRSSAVCELASWIRSCVKRERFVVFLQDFLYAMIISCIFDLLARIAYLRFCRKLSKKSFHLLQKRSSSAFLTWCKYVGNWKINIWDRKY